MNEASDAASTFRLRDYQLDALARIFDEFAIDPAGPPDDPLVAHCRGDRTGEDGNDGGTGEALAGGKGDDDQPPF